MDIPLLFVAVSLMSLIMYFLASLDYEAGKFWIYFLVWVMVLFATRKRLTIAQSVYTSAFALTQFYRAVSALSPSFNEGE